MKDRKPRLPEIIGRFSEVFPKMDDAMRRIALSTYRRLARGVPALPEEIAADAERPPDQVRRVLADWIGVYTDVEGRVYGFWGLAIPAMKHRFDVDGVRLHAWCAWDALFLPELIGKTAHIESACEISGQPVCLTISPSRVESAEPSSPVISFLMPDACEFDRDVIKKFCHYVNFFRTREAGETWIAKNPGTFLLTLDEAVELGRLKNQAQFGPLLQSAAAGGSAPVRGGQNQGISDSRKPRSERLI
jgi:alkylmercury lyase